MSLLRRIIDGFHRLGFGHQWVLLACIASVIALTVALLPIALQQRERLSDLLIESSQLNAKWLSQSIASHLYFEQKGQIDDLLSALEADPRVLSAVVLKLDQFDGQLYLYAYFSRMDSVPETLEDVRALQPSEVVEVTEAIELEFQNIGQIKLFLSNRSVKEAAYTSMRWAMIAWFAGTLLMVMFTRWIKGYLIRPLARLDDFMQDIADSRDYSRRAPVEGHDEISDLTRSLNTFVSRLEDYEEIRESKEREIVELNAVLEDRVAQRTQELERSIEHLKETQEQMVEQEKLASLGGLVAGLTHEVNTPIGIGLTAGSHLREQLDILRQAFESGSLTKHKFIDTMETLTESCTMIQSNLERAAEQIRSFKVVAIDQSSDAARIFNLKDYVTSVITSLKPTLKRTAIDIDIIMDDAIEIQSYPGVFSQIVTNLVINSVSHAFEADQQGRIRIAAYWEGDNLVVDYADDGKGIDPSIKDRLFDAFVTTARDRGGSGLGTHIVHSLVTRSLGGEVECVSQPGQGTRFLLKIPKHQIAPKMDRT